jgi:hypothetical protein
MIAVESVCFAIWPPRPKKDAKNPSKYLCPSQFPRQLTGSWPTAEHRHWASLATTPNLTDSGTLRAHLPTPG